MKILLLFIIFLFMSCASTKNEIIVEDNIEQDSLINNYSEIVSMFMNNTFDTITYCDNYDANEEFKKRIAIVDIWTKKKQNHLYNDDINFIIINFELLTKIESESDANFFGKYNPTEKDIEKWISWFEDNKEKICWYKEKDILFLKK